MVANTLHELLEVRFSEARLLDLWTKLFRPEAGGATRLSQKDRRNISAAMCALVQAISAEVGAALTVSTSQARRLRWKLIQELANVELRRRGQRGASIAHSEHDQMLTVARAAQVLGCSRPHVSMLLDEGRLQGAVMSPRGDWRIPRASVLARKKASGGDADYKRAAREAGMYFIPEETYVKSVARRLERGTSRKKTAGRK